MRSKVRAYSHQGHGPRAEQQAGYISATSDSTPSVAKSSRSIPSGHNRKPAIADMSFRCAPLAVIPYILNRRPGSIPKAVLQIRINRKPAREPEHEFALL